MGEPDDVGFTPEEMECVAELEKLLDPPKAVELMQRLRDAIEDDTDAEG